MPRIFSVSYNTDQLDKFGLPKQIVVDSGNIVEAYVPTKYTGIMNVHEPEALVVTAAECYNCRNKIVFKEMINYCPYCGCAVVPTIGDFLQTPTLQEWQSLRS